MIGSRLALSSYFLSISSVPWQVSVVASYGKADSSAWLMKCPSDWLGSSRRPRSAPSVPALAGVSRWNVAAAIAAEW